MDTVPSESLSRRSQRDSGALFPNSSPSLIEQNSSELNRADPGDFFEPRGRIEVKPRSGADSRGAALLHPP
eukprot:scaffold69_cov248-Pinguiococcus_pyrenoidosus.AAC.49